MADFLARLREGDQVHPALSSTSAARTVVAVRGSTSSRWPTGWRRWTRRAGSSPDAGQAAPKALPVGDVEAISGCRGARHHPRPCATGRSWRCSTAPVPASPRRSGSTSTTSTWWTAPCCCAARGQGAPGPGRVVRPRGGGRLPRPRPAGAGGDRARHARPLPQRPRRPPLAAVGVGGPGQGGGAGGDHQDVSPHTSATRSRPTSSTVVPTSASCRSCSATRR